MDILFEKILRPVFFTRNPEDAHNYALNALRLLDALPLVPQLMQRYHLRPRGTRPVKLWGLEFPNLVGLAAGFDKNALAWPVMGALGFGHVEIGTITLHGQPGNDKPRVFRYPKREAVVNRMGFPNVGAEKIARSLAKMPAKGKRAIPLGINIGKSKITSLEEAHADYLGSFRLLADYADFMVVNISSPNTPGLRELQGRKYLVDLLGTLRKENLERAARLSAAPIPFLLKIAPDLNFQQLEDILSIVAESGFDGIVATNTTITRPADMPEAETTGGLSGRPLLEKSLEAVRFLVRTSGGKIPVIGCGGICDIDAAGRFMDEGAAMVQLYTGMIYRGPFFPAAVARSLAWHHRHWA